MVKSYLLAFGTPQPVIQLFVGMFPDGEKPLVVKRVLLGQLQYLADRFAALSGARAGWPQHTAYLTGGKQYGLCSIKRRLRSLLLQRLVKHTKCGFSIDALISQLVSQKCKCCAVHILLPFEKCLLGKTNTPVADCGQAIAQGNAANPVKKRAGRLFGRSIEISLSRINHCQPALYASAIGPFIRQPVEGSAVNCDR